MGDCRMRTGDGRRNGGCETGGPGTANGDDRSRNWWMAGLQDAGPAMAVTNGAATVRGAGLSRDWWMGIAGCGTGDGRRTGDVRPGTGE